MVLGKMLRGTEVQLIRTMVRKPMERRAINHDTHQYNAPNQLLYERNLTFTTVKDAQGLNNRI